MYKDYEQNIEEVWISADGIQFDNEEDALRASYTIDDYAESHPEIPDEDLEDSYNDWITDTIDNGDSGYYGIYNDTVPVRMYW